MRSPDPTQRFSTRVQAYSKYRPGYPDELYALLRREMNLQTSATIADLGSGTGLLSKLFLQHGHLTFGVEPNTEMRLAAETMFADQQKFVSIAGRAEVTTLPDQSIDLVVAGQAFHWFDAAAARQEMLRILKPDGQVALIWNQRDQENSTFMRAYEELLERFGTDFAQVDQQRTVSDEGIAALFAPLPVEKVSLPNQQVFDSEGLRGRLLSSSYTPAPDDEDFELMLASLSAIFNRYQRDGRVTFVYKTVAYYGRLAT